MRSRGKYLLLPLSPLYGAILRLRSAAYRKNALRSHQLGIPVISVGNLTHGGTGKTPLVEALVRDLIRRGRRPAILTRGYGRGGDEALVLVGPRPETPVEESGDEPLELACRLPGVPIVIDRDRVRGGARAIALGADCVVLDDGFQHLRLRRDLNILLVDAGDPWGGGHLPPRGRLREPLRAIHRADLILVTKIRGGNIPEEILESLSLLHPGCPVHGLRMAPSKLLSPQGPQELESLEGREVLAVAGIARPSAFVDILRDLGARIMEERFFPDHHNYSCEEMRQMEARAEERDWRLVTTAKDAVKLKMLSSMWVMEIRVAPLDKNWSFLWKHVPELEV